MLVMLVISLIGLIASYFVLLGIFGLVPVSTGFKPAPDGVRIYLVNNGVHSDVVLPSRSDIADWTQIFSMTDFRDLSAPQSFIAFGWGDRGFYLDIPTWSDLTMKVAIVALSGIDTTLMHVQYMEDPTRTPGWIALDISPEQHEKLVRYVRESFQWDERGRPRPVPGHTYFGTDAFYEAEGRFSLFVTCNEWVRRGLAKAGIRTAAWSPLMWPLFWQLRAYRQERVV